MKSLEALLLVVVVHPAVVPKHQDRRAGPGRRTKGTRAGCGPGRTAPRRPTGPRRSLLLLLPPPPWPSWGASGTSREGGPGTSHLGLFIHGKHVALGPPPELLALLLLLLLLLLPEGRGGGGGGARYAAAAVPAAVELLLLLLLLLGGAAFVEGRSSSSWGPCCTATRPPSRGSRGSRPPGSPPCGSGRPRCS